MKNINSILSKNIAEFRKKTGLTQEQLAENLGVTFQAVSKWETGKSAPDICFLPIIAELFECSIDDLFSFLPKKDRVELNVLPNLSAPDNIQEFVSKQIKGQLDNNGSSNKFLSIIAENSSGSFELTDENIERLLDAYRELYKGIQKK